MPVSQLFEVTIDAAGVSTSKRVSKLSRKNRRRLSASGRVMESSLPLPPVLPGPGRARGSARKVPPPLLAKLPLVIRSRLPPDVFMNRRAVVVVVFILPPPPTF